MLSIMNDLVRIVWLVACVLLADVTLVLAQGQSGTFNGRVIDQGEAVLVQPSSTS